MRLTTMRSRIKGLLDFVATVAMIAAAVAVIWTTLRAPQSPSRGTTINGGLAPGPTPYQPGEKFGPVAGFNSGSSPKTLILFLRSNCTYCTQSMDFYTRLAAMPGRPRMVVVGTEPEQSLRDYTKQYGFAADQILTVPRSALRFTGTPALALVRSDGTVEGVWLGKVSGDQEGEVMRFFGG